MKCGHLFAVVFLFVQGSGSCEYVSDAARLMDDVFNRRYVTMLRPACEANAPPLDVVLALYIRRVVEMVESAQMLYVNAWIRLLWNDCQLVWDPANYSGLKMMILPHTKVWVPDVLLFDYAEIETPDMSTYQLVVNHNGDVIYNYPYVLAIRCRLDVTYFPIDAQECPIRFGSWAHDEDMINLTNLQPSADLSDLVYNNELRVVSAFCRRKRVSKMCGGRLKSFPQVIYHLKVERKPLFYVMNMLFPYLIITVLSVLGFLIPPDAGEKIALEITVLLSLAVFLGVVSETLPPSSDTLPFMSLYFSGAIFLVSLSTILSTIVLNVHHTDHKPVPKCMLDFLERISRIRLFRDILGLTRGDAMAMATQRSIIARFKAVQSLEQQRRRLTEGAVDPPLFIGRKNFNMSANSMTDDDANSNTSDKEFQHCHFDLSKVLVPDYTDQLEDMLSTLNKQLSLLQKMETRKEIKQNAQHQKNEWRELAMLLDRLFLVLFVALYLVTCVVIVLPLVVTFPRL